MSMFGSYFSKGAKFEGFSKVGDKIPDFSKQKTSGFKDRVPDFTKKPSKDIEDKMPDFEETGERPPWFSNEYNEDEK